MSDRAFLHSGKLGDIVYSLAALRALGGGRLFLQPEPRLEFRETDVEFAIPLLASQSYITSVSQWRGEPIDCNFDGFRDQNPGGNNLVDCHSHAAGLREDCKERAWLEVPPAKREGQARVILARTRRRRGASGFWPNVYREVRRSAAFVGTPEEHAAFVQEIGPIEHLRCDSLLDMARHISASELFAGNQSCAYALAEGMKKPAILEVDPEAMNCLFERNDCLPVLDVADVKRIPAFIRTVLKTNSLPPSVADETKWPRIVNTSTQGQLGAAKRAGTSIVILTFNSLSTIDACLTSVEASISDQDEVIVVDNRSSDGTRSYLLARFGNSPSVRLIFNPENLGFSQGCNVGLRVSTGSTLCLLNPDTVVSPGWLEMLRVHLNDPSVGAVGPTSDCVAGDQFFTRFADQSPIDTKLLIGFCLMMRREVLNSVGLLDESLFLGSDDLELSLRLRSNGYRLRVAPEVFVRHIGGKSFGSLDPRVKERIVFESTEQLLSNIRSWFGFLPDPKELWGIDMIHT